MSNWKSFSKQYYATASFPSSLYLARGMLSKGEMQMLFSATSRFFSGRGLIVDAGAFAGMSAYCLAKGLKHNGDLVSDGTVIHSFDIFKADDAYTRDYLKNVFFTSQDVNGNRKEILYSPDVGEDFLDVFWHQNHDNRSLIEVHQGDFLEKSWGKGGIEILFVDVCKTLRLQSHLLSSFFPSLIPGESVVIQQDYHHPYHPYIHVAMEVLEEYFQVLISQEGGSRVYLVKEIPPLSIINELIDYSYDAQTLNTIFERIVIKSPESERALLRLANVIALVQRSFRADALQKAIDLMSQLDENKHLWLRQELKLLVERLNSADS